LRGEAVFASPLAFSEPLDSPFLEVADCPGMERDWRATGHPIEGDVLRCLVEPCQFGPFLVDQLRNLIGEARIEITMDDQYERLADRWDVCCQAWVELLEDCDIEEEVSEFLLEGGQDGVKWDEFDPDAWYRRQRKDVGGGEALTSPKECG